MRSRTIIAIATVLLGIVVLVWAAAYMMLRGMDLTRYSPEIVSTVRAATGRELRIDGRLEIALSDGLAIRVHGLTLSNAAWGSRPEMLRLGHAEAQLALLPLLLGEIRVRRIDLHDVDVILETDASGKGNWSFDVPSGARGRADMELPSIRIESGRVTWHRVRQADAEPLVFNDLQLDASVHGDGVQLGASASLEHEVIELSGRMPSPRALSSGNPGDLALRLRFMGGEIKGSGTLRRAPWGIDPRLELRADGLDLAALGYLAGRPLPVLPKLAIAFDLSREEGAWRVENLYASAGASDLTGEVQLSTVSTPPRLTANLQSRRLDLSELYPLSPAQEDVTVAPEARDRKPAMDLLKTLDGALRLRVTEMITWDLDLADVEIDGQLEGGRLALEPIRAGIAGAERAEGRFTLDTGADRPGWGLVLRARQLPAGVMLGPRRASLVDAPLDLDAQLKSVGSSLQQVIRNLSGDVRLVVGGGRARTKRMDSLVGGLSTLTGQLLAQGSEDAQLNCAVADVQVQQGVAKAKVLLIDTPVSTVRGDGQVDLGARQIDLTFTPRPKNPTLSVAVPVHVRGPMRQPEFIADRKATLGKLIGVAGLFVYPPAALVALGDMGGSGNPCIELMRGEQASGASDTTAGKVQEGLDGVAKDVGRGLKKLLGQ